MHTVCWLCAKITRLRTHINKIWVAPSWIIAFLRPLMHRTYNIFVIYSEKATFSSGLDLLRPLRSSDFSAPTYIRSCMLHSIWNRDKGTYSAPVQVSLLFIRHMQEHPLLYNRMENKNYNLILTSSILILKRNQNFKVYLVAFQLFSTYLFEHFKGFIVGFLWLSKPLSSLFSFLDSTFS